MQDHRIEKKNNKKAVKNINKAVKNRKKIESYEKIIYRYLAEQKNRTILTIIGIILSVAMVSAIGTIINSTRKALIKEAIRESGSHHASYVNINSETLNRISNHVEVEESGISLSEGFCAVRETTEEEIESYGRNISFRYLKLDRYDDKALNMLPFKIKVGRLPKDSDEIAIEYWMVNYFQDKINLGDTINLTIGKRILDDEGNELRFEKTGIKEYKLVGLIDPGYVWKGNLITKAITGLGENYTSERGTNDYSAYVKLHSIKNANEKINNIASDVGLDKEHIKYNERVLRLSAESLNDTFNSTIIALLAFFIILIVVSTIAVIYNSFNISVLERVSQFGLLRSVGATPSQIMGIVLREAFVLSIVAIPIGLFSGVFAMKIVFHIISLLKFNMALIKDMEISISFPVFVFSTIIGLITVFLSAIGPARKAGKVSPLEAVRNVGSIKKESFNKVKKSPFSLLIRKMMGIEGEIAYKNLKRNRKRFIITVFSMVISITLYITFSSFSDYMFIASFIDISDNIDYSIAMRDIEITNKIYEEVREINDVKRAYKVRKLSGEILISESKISKKLKELTMSAGREFQKKNNLVVVDNVNLVIIGDDNFEILKDSLKEGSINKEYLDKEDGVLVINNTYVYNEKTHKSSLIEGYGLKHGDKVSFMPYQNRYDSNEKLNEESKNIEYNELKVIGVLEKGLFSASHDLSYNLNGSINMITTEKVFNKIAGLSVDNDVSNDENRNSKNLNSINTSIFIKMKENFEEQSIKTYFEEKENNITGFNYYDFAEMARENRNASIVFSIFLYGFVSLIALISSINIINTISTNIILRTREISMIKAVGMTQGGIKRMVAFESFFYGLYSAIIGGFIGSGLTYVLFNIVIRIREFEWTIPWKNIGIACTGAAFVAIISGILPLKKINKGIIVENMKLQE